VRSAVLLGLLVVALLPVGADAGPSCLLVADADSGTVLERQGECADRYYPMSTFKIPLAVMGFDAKILQDPQHPSWSYKPEFDRPERERKATDPTIWLRDSIVWYSQEITRKLGQARFKDYVERFAYGNRNVGGGPGGTDGLTASWLMSSLEISPEEQVQFLRKLVAGELPVSREAIEQTQRSMPVFDAQGWTVRGKTGSGYLCAADGTVDRRKPLGWFVGWADKGGRKVVFARLLILDGPSETPASFKARDALLADLPGAAEP
jgi:beta-lactamase class D